MSVMTHFQDACASQAMKSSADTNPRALYPSEPRLSTRAMRNDSSSSTTAIRNSLDTSSFPRISPRRIVGSLFWHVMPLLGTYTGVLLRHLRQRPRADQVRHPDQV